MKKLFSLILIAMCFVNSSVFALTLDQRIEKVEARYEQRIEKIDTMRGKDARKEILKRHAREDADLKIQHLKDLDALKVKKSDKNS